MIGGRGGAGFEDRLRAIGWLLDERGQHLVALALAEHGATMRVTAAGGEPGEMGLSPSELVLVQCAARGRRGRGDAAVPQAGYQGALRAMGRALDERGGRACRLHTHGEGFVVQVRDGEDEADWRPLQLGPEARATAPDEA